MSPRQIKQHCQITDESQELIRVATTELNLSARFPARVVIAQPIHPPFNASTRGAELLCHALIYPALERRAATEQNMSSLKPTSRATMASTRKSKGDFYADIPVV